MTSDEHAWERRHYLFPRQRFGEFTDDKLKTRYRQLGDDAIAELISFPALFTYEDQCKRPARLGRVTKITSRGNNLRLGFELFSEVKSIPPSQLSELSLELDIAGWEMNRTHWAIKDVDLIEVLREAELTLNQSIVVLASLAKEARYNGASPGFEVHPTVFSVPKVSQEQDLVAIMMPFSKEYDEVRAAIETACKEIDLRCERADDIWDHSTIIQDIVNLIYRSAVVIVDFSSRNPNMMYETGIAHTLGRPVVPISQSFDDIPFDLVHHRTLNYFPNKEGLEEMTEKLKRRLKKIAT